MLGPTRIFTVSAQPWSIGNELALILVLWKIQLRCCFKHCPLVSDPTSVPLVIIDAETEVIAVSSRQSEKPSRLAGLCLGKSKASILSDRYCYLPSHTLGHHSPPLVYFHFFSTRFPIPVYASHWHRRLRASHLTDCSDFHRASTTATIPIRSTEPRQTSSYPVRAPNSVSFSER